MRAALHPLTVASVEPLTDDAVAIGFAIPGELADAYRFLPGQHVAIATPAAGDDLRRSYSICSPAGAELRVAVKRIPGGAFSSHALDGLRPGDVLDVMTPTGRFAIEPDPTRAAHYVAIAAGSGITPVLSIAASALALEPASRVTLLYGNRTTRSIMLLDELQDLKDRHPDRFVLHHVLSREPRDAELLSGRIDPERLERFLAALLPVDGVDEWFLCGPAGLIDGAEATLRRHGVPGERIHHERFHADDLAAPAAEPSAPTSDTAAQVTIRLDGRSTSFELAPDGPPILDAALPLRPDAPFACKGGVCGTCRARLVEGEVELTRSWALDADEREAGYVLACQAHPRSERVVLDFD